MKELCEVVYLERTKGISSSDLRATGTKIVRLGIVGAGRIAGRFVAESKFVSGIDVCGVLAPHHESAGSFATKHELEFSTTEYEELLSRCDAVYVASPHNTHFSYAKAALDAGKHVLCEKPMTLSGAECRELYDLARHKNLVLLEAIKTAFCTAFVILQKAITTLATSSISMRPLLKLSQKFAERLIQCLVEERSRKWALMSCFQ